MRAGCRSEQSGFGLIELVIAMVIIAILAAIALPSYQNFVERSRRSVAVSTLTELYTQQQQQGLSQRGATSTAPSFDRLTGIDAKAVCVDKSGRYSPCPGTDSVYMFEMLTDAGGAWGGIQATAVGAQVKDKDCQTLTLNAAGQQIAKNSDGGNNSEECWR